jgi:hypothetical protein
VQARLRSLKDDRPIQTECNLRCVVAVSMRNVRGRQQKQALWPNIELKRRRGHISQFIQAWRSSQRIRCRYEHSCNKRCIVTAVVRGRLKNPLQFAELTTAMEKVHRAGMPGVFAEVRDGDQVWRSATGVADLSTGRPVTPDMRHRVGSITKTFTAAAVLQQVESGQIGLDTPIGHYLPRLVRGERGDAITVRMLINHTSGLAEYLPYAYPSLKAFPSLAETKPESLDHNRFTRFHPTELIEMGVAAPAVGTPGGTPGACDRH